MLGGTWKFKLISQILHSFLDWVSYCIFYVIKNNEIMQIQSWYVILNDINCLLEFLQLQQKH